MVQLVSFKYVEVGFPCTLRGIESDILVDILYMIDTGSAGTEGKCN